MSKNKTFTTDGNDHLDLLLCILESQGVLSDSYKTKIINLSLWILSNHKNYVSEIREGIQDLETDMQRLTIFSSGFIINVITLLNNGLEFEINKHINSL